MQTYITAIRRVAIARPQNPPAASPKFQPKKSPEMTAPTPSAHKSTQPALRRRRRFSR
jgi:hypothetical protein